MRGRRYQGQSEELKVTDYASGKRGAG